MSATLIKGTVVREEILEEISADVEKIKEAHGVVPSFIAFQPPSLQAFDGSNTYSIPSMIN